MILKILMSSTTLVNCRCVPAITSFRARTLKNCGHFVYSDGLRLMDHGCGIVLSVESA